MQKQGMESFPIDADEDNEIMKRMLFRYGFSYCGTIRSDHSVKTAYEKVLT